MPDDDRTPDPPVMNNAALYRIITESERWQDRVSSPDNENHHQWRTGFNAAMQRLEIYGRPIIEGSATAPDEVPE